MQLHKTDRARAELKPGTRTLGQRERTLLLLADGSKSVLDFRPLFNGDGEEIALRLLREGFLEAHPSDQLHAAVKPAKTFPHQPSPPVPQVAAQQAQQQQHFPSPETTQAIKVSADQFEGKRSLATTRMFLFDICERMFARRNPEMAELFREALRNAKDRDTMLAVSRDMIGEIETVAGHERADSISERLAMLLPVSAPESTAA
jgi:hypothetical protein